MDSWETSLELGNLIYQAHGTSPQALAERHRRFGIWALDTATADHLTVTLLALALHSLALDTAAATGQPATAAGLDEITFATLIPTVANRPRHEFLAGLPATGSSYPGSEHVDVLRLLIYDGSGKAALTVERLAKNARITLEDSIDRSADPDLTCARLST